LNVYPFFIAPWWISETFNEHLSKTSICRTSLHHEATMSF